MSSEARHAFMSFGFPPISFLYVHCQFCFFPALLSVIFFSTFLAFSFSTCYFELSSFLFSHPLLTGEGLSSPYPHCPLDQLYPGYFSFFSYGPWNGKAFSFIRQMYACNLGTLLSYLPICPKSCSKISVDSFSFLLYFRGCY